MLLFLVHHNGLNEKDAIAKYYKLTKHLRQTETHVLLYHFIFERKKIHPKKHSHRVFPGLDFMFKMLSQEIEIILKIPIFISITFFDTSFFMEKGEKEGKKQKHFFMKFSIIRIIMFE